MKTMTTHKKLLSLTALTAVLGASFVGVQNANAQAQQDLNATAQFQVALVTSLVSDMDFGTIGVTNPTPDPASSALLATDGSITYTNDFQGSGSGVIGQVDITAGSTGTDIDIFCDTTITLDSGATPGNTIDVTGIGFDFNSATTGAPSTACNGATATAAATNQVSSFNANINLGGTLDASTISGGLDQEALYDSTGANGAAAVVRVAYK